MKWIKENAGLFAFGIFIFAVIGYVEMRISTVKTELRDEIKTVKTELKEEMEKGFDKIDKKINKILMYHSKTELKHTHKQASK